MKRFYLFALVAMIFAACTTDETQDVQLADVPETLTVSFEEDTRIQLNEAQKTVWSKGDLVSVFYKSDANDCWKFTGDTGDRTATLQRVSKGEGTRRGDNVIVVYPYRSDYLVSLSSNSIEAYLPATQTYCEGSYGVGSSPMVGFGDYKQFVLKNVCGWLKLQLTGNGEKVQSISLKGNNGEQVAGDILIVAEDASTILASASVDVDDSEVGGSLLLEDDILTEVTLDCGNGVELGAEATAFYIALPPQTFEKGLTVEIADTSGYTMTQSTDKSLTIERNTIQPMAEINFVNTKPTNNEIWYTATAKVEPFYPDEFGATITSNVWDSETGKGIITFNANVTKIGYYAFNKCTKLKTITIPDSVTEIGEWAFNFCTSLTSVTILDSVTSIGQGVFGYCTSLTSVTIPDSVTKIENYAFYDCTLLTSVNIPNSVTEIGIGAFYNCTSLTSITIPDSVTSIGRSAFLGCTSLTSVTIPDSVTEIGQDAFFRCTSLKTVYCKPTTPPAGGDYMFYNNASGRRIFVPASDDDSIINAYKAKQYWSDYASYIEEYHEFVDLGLSVKWANCNIGANEPGDAGNYYMWADLVDRKSENYSADKYPYLVKSEVQATDKDGNLMFDEETGAPIMTEVWNYADIGANISGSKKYDVARKEWGATWRVPTSEEVQELIANCTFVWTNYKSATGFEITSKINGAKIFMPAAGFYMGTASCSYFGSNGSYWTASAFTGEKVGNAYYILMTSGRGFRLDYTAYHSAHPIRPVTE